MVVQVWNWVGVAVWATRRFTTEVEIGWSLDDASEADDGDGHGPDGKQHASWDGGPGLPGQGDSDGEGADADQFDRMSNPRGVSEYRMGELAELLGYDPREQPGARTIEPVGLGEGRSPRQGGQHADEGVRKTRSEITTIPISGYITFRRRAAMVRPGFGRGSDPGE